MLLTKRKLLFPHFFSEAYVVGTHASRRDASNVYSQHVFFCEETRNIS